RGLAKHVRVGAGYEVDSATTLAEARSFLDTVNYELLLADGRLPDGTGMELAERAEAGGAKVLIITGYAFQLVAEDLGRYDFLMKPVRPAELIAAIERVLGGKSQRPLVGKK